MFDSPSSSLLPVPPLLSQQKETFQRRPNLFGDAALADVYYRAKELIIEHKMLRLARCEFLDDGVHQLTICNLWRIERLPDGKLRHFEFDLSGSMWIEVDQDSLDQWPKIRLIQRSGALDWKAVIAKVVQRALKEAGYWGLTHQKKGMPRERVAEILIRHYQKEAKFGESFRVGMLSVMACLHRHIIKKDVLSALLVVGLQYADLPTYLHYHAHREGLLKVARERRNLLPLLPLIHPEQRA